MKEKDKKINNIVFLITIILYFIAIITYELLFCNSEIMNNLLRNAGTKDATFNFSFYRILLYTIFLCLLIVFRKYFQKDLIKNNSNKWKKILIILYTILAIIGIILTTVFIFTKQIPLPRIAMFYITIIMGEICLIYISNNYIKNIIVFTFTLAITMVVTVDINNYIDEARHFITAYNVSLGNFNYRKNPVIDKGFYELDHGIKYTNISNLFKNDFHEELTKELNKEDLAKMPTDYNAFTYMPSAIGISIAKMFSKNMADIYFSGRLFNLITFMGLIVLTFKLLPYKKKIFFVIATMPLVFLMSTVYSADMSCIGITFVFIAYCLNLYNREHIGIKQIIGLIAMFIVLLIPKSMSYIFVAFMMLILPIKKIIKENKKYMPYIIFSILVILGIMAYILLNQNVPDDVRGGNTSKVEQIKYLIQNPTHIVKVGISHICLTLLNFNWLSQLNVRLFFGRISYEIFLLMMIYILLISLLDTSKNFKIKDKIIMIMTFFITYGITSMILYLVFTPVGEGQINGYQTRYIFPILPLVLMTFSSNLVQAKKVKNINTIIACISGIFLMLGVIGNVMV